MDDPVAPPMALLVVRAWIEGEPPTLRARVTQTPDLGGQPQRSSSAASVDDVCDAVRAWIETFTASVSR